VVITDRDPQLAGNRAATLDALANGFGARPQLSVYSNAVTLEHELFAAGNEALLREVFVELHPRSGQRWDVDIAAQPANERPGAFVLLLSAMEVRKGDFAQTLAEHIVAGQAFAVPVYIRDAILKVSEA
jgi:putative ATP-dependent endonuclease of OLD family